MHALSHDEIGTALESITANANPEVLGHPFVGEIAERTNATRAQVVFRFAEAVGMLPLTGTSDRGHMEQDLASSDLVLSSEEVDAIESLTG